ncbi:right-handed parallel beta-helix repeat-containing protein [Calycomorphotria hydatis]|uniref:Right handed beta helix domain-containing protein n=1 Tax=Calycomorphotria hydatis TaxID=2528027 RepID=A0A517T3Y9_9PLAN|nr:right-handed parallel beta-helix repeat-containing protein [Calycomorphotria hydatis]QDT63090.1 hypothetical protein V22_02900 [Calycomorphotria hydatis]
MVPSLTHNLRPLVGGFALLFAFSLGTAEAQVPYNPNYNGYQQPFFGGPGQQPFNYTHTPEVVNGEVFGGFTTRGTVQVNAGNGPGWEDGYTSFSAFVPLMFSTQNHLFFIDARGFVAYNENGGANIGAGYRQYLPSINHFWGISGWIDTEDANAEATQLTRGGLSLELIGRWLQYRINGYVPFNDTETILSATDTTNPVFTGYNIALRNETAYRDQYGGLDGEVGGPLPLIGQYGFSGFLGAYYLTSDSGGSSGGFQFRMTEQINENIQVGMRVTHDSIFDTNVWLTLDMRTPRGSWYNYFKNNVLTIEDVYNQMDYEVERNYRVASKIREVTTLTALTDPKDGSPIMVVHVDPTATSGDGSFESPFPTLESLDSVTDTALDTGIEVASSWDIIRVVASTSATTLTNAGMLELQDCQRLLSSAVGHTFISGGTTYTLPGFTGGIAPTITNSNVSGIFSPAVISLGGVDPSTGTAFTGNNTEISGFTIDGSYTNASSTTSNRIGILGPPIAIAGAATGLTGLTDDAAGSGTSVEAAFNINRNTFTGVSAGALLTYDGNAGSSGSGIDSTPTGIIYANTVTGIGSGSNFGFSVESIVSGSTVSTTPLGLVVLDNTISAIAGEDANGNLVLDKGEDVTTGSGITNGLLDPGIGIYLSATGGAGIGIPALADIITIGGTTIYSDRNSDGLLDNIAGNSVTTSGKGFVASADTASTIAFNSYMNSYTGNLVAGTGARLSADGASTITANFYADTFSGNTGYQFGIDTAGASTVIATIDGDEGFAIGRTGTVGTTIASGTLGTGGIDVLNEEGSIVSLAIDNTIMTGSGNGPGINAESNDGSFFMLDVGTPFLSQTLPVYGSSNSITGFAGAGIGVILNDTSTGEIRIQNNTINSIVDDSNALTPFNGDGIYIGTTGSSTLDTLVGTAAAGSITNRLVSTNTTTQINCNFVGTNAALATGLGNADNGIELAASGSSTMNNVQIGNDTTATGATTGNVDNNDGNYVANNGTDGLFVSREGTATIDGLEVEDNSFINNSDDGAEFSIAGARASTSDLIDVTFEDNTSFSNGDDGVVVGAIGDGQLDINMFTNILFQNGGDGIQSQSTRRTATDASLITTSVGWLGNTITENGGHGIQMAGLHSGIIIGATGTFVDGAGNTDNASNLIDLNGLSGILMTGPGSFSIVNNDITRNGQSTATGVTDGTNGHGVDIQGAGFKSVTLTGNRITENTNDGVEFNNNGAESPFTFTLTASGNDVSDNGRRGYDILNQGTSDSVVLLSGETINGNGEEGVYVVNTSSTTQAQNVAATATLASDGAVTAEPYLIFSMTGSTLIGNGLTSGFSSTGLVMRVGTSGGEDDQGAFTIGVQAPNPDVGGVIATITGNTSSGNLGDDYYFESFTSTVDPTANVFTQTIVSPLNGTEEFDVTNEGQSDPLARLALTFNSNILDSIDATNVGAFYTNADGVKSAVNDPTDGVTAAQTGPFDTNTRPRNAQRIGIIGNTVAGVTLPGPDGPSVVFPGLGDSTFTVLGTDTNTIGGVIRLNSFVTVFGGSEDLPGEDAVPGFDQDFVWDLTP